MKWCNDNDCLSCTSLKILNYLNETPIDQIKIKTSFWNIRNSSLEFANENNETKKYLQNITSLLEDPNKFDIVEIQINFEKLEFIFRYQHIQRAKKWAYEKFQKGEHNF